MLNLPASFKEKYINLLGKDKANEMFTALAQEPKKAFRINSLCQNQQVSYATSEPVPDMPNAYYGEISGQDPEWVSGTVYSQDPAAMFPAYVADVQPGMKVLDLCAAPGGKTTALGEKLKGQGLLVANEISASRAKILRENIERWGISNALVTNNDSASLAQKFPAFFDLVLVDAPCSGEGMFRKNPEAIKYWSPEYVLTCQERQKEILTEAVKMIKNGGSLVYSTCTFSPEEDEEIVSWLMQNYELKIQQIKKISSNKISCGHPEWTKSQFPALKNTLRFWPQDNLGEGQFVAVLYKPGQAETIKKTKKRRKKAKNKLALTAKEKELVSKVLTKFNLPDNLKQWSVEVLVRKDHVFVPALKNFDLTGIHVLNNGVELGILKKNRFEPGHQLAEILGHIKQDQVLDLSNRTDYLSYLHGETVREKTDFSGFTLVSYQNKTFSFGKITGNGVLKNFYPKGLRILKKDEEK